MIFLVCGPPGVGKDSLCDHLAEIYPTAIRAAFARQLKQITHLFFNKNVPWDHYEVIKNYSNVDFNSLTPRQAYIFVSEKVIKPTLGNTAFGNMLVKSLTDANFDTTKQHCFISDSGFADEAIPLGEKYGYDQLLQIKIHRDGYDFSNDSRTYWNHPKIQSIDLVNNDTLGNFFTQGKQIVEKYGG